MTESRPRVYVAQPIDPDAVDALSAQADVVLGYGPNASPLSDEFSSIDGMVVRTLVLDVETIARARKLRVIMRIGAGVDNIDIPAATRQSIAVFSTAGANAKSVAEMTIALALAVARDIPRWDRDTRAGLFATREQDPGRELSGRTWGVIGFGTIGESVGRIARLAFGMDVLAHHPRRDPEHLASRGAEACSLTDLLSRSDVVSVHVPLTDETRGLLGREQFAHMRPDAMLIDVSRGGVVDPDALAHAVTHGVIDGAAVDVYDTEPPAPGHPFLAIDRIILSPHRAGRTVDAVRAQGVGGVQRLLEYLLHGERIGALNESSLRG